MDGSFGANSKSGGRPAAVVEQNNKITTKRQATVTDLFAHIPSMEYLEGA